MVQTDPAMALQNVVRVETTPSEKKTAFTSFVSRSEPKLRRALVAWYGGEVGREALAEALAWAWQEWERVSEMDNAAGYLFRVGQTHARRMLRRRSFSVPLRGHDDIPDNEIPWIEPALANGIKSLSKRQRAVVVLVYAFDLSHAETAELLGIRRSTVQNHAERGMARLRKAMEVHHGG